MNSLRTARFVNVLTTLQSCARLRSNNARQGYVGLRIDTLKSAGYFFLGLA